MKSRSVVSASEIGEYVYCKRAWWLRINGKLPQTTFMQDGIEKHDSFYLFLTSLKTRLLFAKVLVILGILVLLFSMSIMLLNFL